MCNVQNLHVAFALWTLQSVNLTLWDDTLEFYVDFWTHIWYNNYIKENKNTYPKGEIIMSKLVEGKYYSVPMGLVRQAFADGYLDEGTDFVVGISVDSNMCPTYWFGDGMDVVDTDDALDAIAEGLGLEDESIADIFYLGNDDDDVCYIMMEN